MLHSTTSSGPSPDWAQGKVVSFAATRAREPFQRLAHDIVNHLQALHLATGFVTGGCVGGDHFIGETLFSIFPDHRHTVIVPADRSRLAAWWRRHVGINVIEMAPDTDYKDRNLAMVNFSDVLIGYPLYDERDARSRRSGSWQTIRMARRMHAHRPLFYPVGALAA